MEVQEDDMEVQEEAILKQIFWAYETCSEVWE